MLLSEISTAEEGQRERLVRTAAAVQEFVDISPTNPAVAPRPPQPHPARDDPVNLEIAVQLQPGFDLGVPGDEAGRFGSPRTRSLTSWVRNPTRSR